MKTWLIVLIVLAVLGVVGVTVTGILAAIVVPQFAGASTEAKLSGLCSNLQTLRSQIKLYRIQHNDIPPSFFNFVAQMTAYSDSDGNTNEEKTAVFRFGPYLQKIPVNYFNERSDATGRHGLLDNTGTVGDDVGSWEYDETTGEIKADDDYDKDGVAGPDHVKI